MQEPEYHLTLVLPDGSQVKLNAESEISYKPYWWIISRNVELKGEGFFEVKPGSRFTVESDQNEVRVLGTSFNIFSRSEKYSVTCITGKVEVSTVNETITLYPNMQSNLIGNSFKINQDRDIIRATDWIQNKFSFIWCSLNRSDKRN